MAESCGLLLLRDPTSLQALAKRVTYSQEGSSSQPSSLTDPAGTSPLVQPAPETHHHSDGYSIAGSLRDALPGSLDSFPSEFPLSLLVPWIISRREAITNGKQRVLCLPLFYLKFTLMSKVTVGEAKVFPTMTS